MAKILGDPPVRELFAFGFRVAVPDLTPSIPPLDTPRPRGASGLPLGLTVLIGEGGSGKTRQAVAISERHSALFLSAGEPRSDLAGLTTELDAVYIAIERGDPLIVIDSLRALLQARSGEAASAGGVSASLFTSLSVMDSIAWNEGRCVLVILNPMTGLFKDVSTSLVPLLLSSVGTVAEPTASGLNLMGRAVNPRARSNPLVYSPDLGASDSVEPAESTSGVDNELVRPLNVQLDSSMRASVIGRRR